MDESRPADRAHAELMNALRLPLTVIMGRVQLLRRKLRRGPPPPDLADQLEAIEAAVIRLAAAVERVDGRDPLP